MRLGLFGKGLEDEFKSFRISHLHERTFMGKNYTEFSVEVWSECYPKFLSCEGDETIGLKRTKK